MASNNLINVIKNDISIVDIIQNYINLNKKGANWWGVCPFHNDTKPSLSVNEQRKMFKCFTCNVGGDAINFVSRYKNISYFEAVLEIAKNFNIDNNVVNEFHNEYQINKETYRQYELNKDYLELSQIFLHQKNDNQGLQYLYNRQLNDEIIEHFGIGYVPNKFDQMYKLLTNEDNSIINVDKEHIYTRQELLNNGLISISNNGDVLDFFNNRVIFSIKDKDGNILGFSGRSIDGSEPKYLNTGETSIFKKHNILYNWNDVSKLDIEDVYLVEGFMDVIALYRAGIKNAVATMGVNFDQNHLKLIKQKQKIKNIILAFDNDNAGFQAIIKNGSSIAKQINTFVVKKYDSQYKDFDELINKTSVQNVIDIANNTEHFSIFYLNYLATEYNFTNQSNSQSYFIKSIQALRDYGNKLFYNQYVNLINSYTNIEKSIIENEIKFLLDSSINEQINNDVWLDDIVDQSYQKLVFKKSNSFNSKRFEFNYPISNKKINPKFNNNQLYTAYIKSQMRLINAILANKNAIKIIEQEFSAKMCNDFKYAYNVIAEFYDEYSSLQSINIDSLNKLNIYMEDNGYSSKIFDLIKNEVVKNQQYNFVFDEVDTRKQAIYSEISWIKYELDIVTAKISKSNFVDNNLINYQIQMLSKLKKLNQKIKEILIYK